jgi:hypothetical protein
MKARRMKWVGHAAVWKTGELRTGFWWRKLMERDNLEYLGVGKGKGNLVTGPGGPIG